MQVNIETLIDDAQCYDTVRELRWPEECQCPHCDSKRVIKRGFDEKEPVKQRYECKDCGKRFDDLTDTIFAGHHQPLKVMIQRCGLVAIQMLANVRQVTTEPLIKSVVLPGTRMETGSMKFM
ncbi:transposase [Desulfobacter sp.]|uniref:transposase n=1 Tax=Desulfobacter sp. TaxID=2294 RepID=UPI003D0F1C41